MKTLHIPFSPSDCFGIGSCAAVGEVETGLTMRNKICVVSCLPVLDNEFYSRALELNRMPQRQEMVYFSQVINIQLPT